MNGISALAAKTRRRSGAAVWLTNATSIGAPSFTKDADKDRDPEMHLTRKGQ